MTLTRTCDIAALICAATYLIGFALLVTLLAPLGYRTNDIDPAAVLAFDAARSGILTAWNTIIYIVNALALVVLVVVLSGPVAVWCRSFDSIMCSKGDELWAQEERMNSARMQCALR